MDPGLLNHKILGMIDSDWNLFTYHQVKSIAVEGLPLFVEVLATWGLNFQFRFKWQGYKGDCGMQRLSFQKSKIHVVNHSPSVKRNTYR